MSVRTSRRSAGLLGSEYEVSIAAPPASHCCTGISAFRRQVASCTLAGLSVFTLGGLCFGFDSVYPVLYSSGAFLDLCAADEAAACAARSGEERQRSCCKAQASSFVSLSSVSLFAADGVMVAYGELMDRRGARWCISVALCLVCTGLALLSIAGSLGASSPAALWWIAFPLIGLAGPGVFMAALSFGELFPNLESVIAPLAASMFDGSAFVFLLWKLLFLRAGLPLSAIAAAWLFLSVLVGGSTWSLLLSKRQTEGMRAEREASFAERVDERAPVSEPALRAAVVWHSEGDGLRQLLCRTDSLLLLLFMCTANLNQTFYLETLPRPLRARPPA
uniref:Uncharacterized protein n=1 Tax=Emiliania huxleyi TaxID=2903 RepID=A0A7S3SUY6_EMIHU